MAETNLEWRVLIGELENWLLIFCGMAPVPLRQGPRNQQNINTMAISPRVYIVCWAQHGFLTLLSGWAQPRGGCQS